MSLSDQTAVVPELLARYLWNDCTTGLVANVLIYVINFPRSCDCVVDVVTGCKLDDLGFSSWQQQQSFPFSKISIQALGTIRPSIKLVLGFLSGGEMAGV